MSGLVAHSSLDLLPLEVTFSRIMCSDVGGSRMARQARLGEIFLCSPAGPWVSCVGLHPFLHLASGLWEREVRGKDRSVSGFPPRYLTLMDCGGVGSVAPVRDSREEWVGWGHRVSVWAL